VKSPSEFVLTETGQALTVGEPPQTTPMFWVARKPVPEKTTLVPTGPLDGVP
jgi:hypothetical protein